MKKPFRVYVQHKLPMNAISAYRIFQPLKILEDQELIEIIEDDFDPTMSPTLRNELLGISDIVFTHAVTGVVVFRDYENLHNIPPRYNPNLGVVDYAPPWILDIDDVYDWVSPTNPAFISWGVRDLAGELVGDGGKIIATLSDGRQEVLFEDGAPMRDKRGKPEKGQIYSYRQNLTKIARLKTAIANVACVTTTTETLRHHIQTEDKPKRIEVLPNCMHRKLFPAITPARSMDRIRVLWQGGGSHYDDWASVRDAMAEVTKKYPEILWVVFGQDYTPLLKSGGISDYNIEFHEWVEYPAHKYELALLGCDINLCIIDPNLFSRGKSSIKYYEASALKVPMCTLATNAPPYNRDIQDGVTGILYDGAEGFIEKLSLLIESPKLRRELAQNASEWVWENRDAEKWAVKMFELFKDVKESEIKKHGDLRELFGYVEGDLMSGNQMYPEDPQEEESAIAS